MTSRKKTLKNTNVVIQIALLHYLNLKLRKIFIKVI